MVSDYATLKEKIIGRKEFNDRVGAIEVKMGQLEVKIDNIKEEL